MARINEIKQQQVVVATVGNFADSLQQIAATGHWGCPCGHLRKFMTARFSNRSIASWLSRIPVPLSAALNAATSFLAPAKWQLWVPAGLISQEKLLPLFRFHWRENC